MAAAEPNGLPVNLPLESYAKHHTNVFSDMRESIKNKADMFLFGEPTDAMVKLMLKIYHENIIRLVSKRSKNSAPMAKVKCMFGIYQDMEDNLYVTISESPGRVGNLRTDSLYNEKRAMVLLLLESAGITVEFPELNKGEGGFAKPIVRDENRWRREDNKVYDIDQVRADIEANGPLMANMLYVNEEEAKDSDVDVYSPELREMPCGPEECVVNWIDSVDYLRKRAANQPTFRPFKKWEWEAGKSKWVAECNNGHLCTESKLFAYAALKGLKHKSFAAYWIGNTLPPNAHIMPKYSYRMDNAEELKKLEGLRDRCDGVLDLPEGLREGYPTFNNTLLSAVQPIAVACPGCFANVQSYINGRLVRWNQSNCYTPRKHAPEVSGGSRKRRSSKKSRKTRRRKSRSTSR
jgi:hypothetical protein